MPTIQIVEEKKVPVMIQEVKEVKQALGFDMNLRSQVEANYDISGSMEDSDKNFYAGRIPGSNMTIMEGLSKRVLSVGLTLDDNGEIPVFAFNSGVEQRGVLTLQNMDTFIRDHFRNRGGGTNYAPLIQRAVADMKKMASSATPVDPMLELVFTDGDNYDHHEAEQALIEASHYPIFYMFIGIYGKGSCPSFRFLHSMDEMGGRFIDNAGFMPLGLFDISDAELYRALLHEYKDYPAKAQAAGLLDANFKWHGQRAGGSGGNRGGGLGGLFGRR